MRVLWGFSGCSPVSFLPLLNLLFMSPLCCDVLNVVYKAVLVLCHFCVDKNSKCKQCLLELETSLHFFDC